MEEMIHAGAFKKERK